MTPELASSTKLAYYDDVDLHESLEFSYEDGILDLSYIQSPLHQHMQQPAIFCISFGNNTSAIVPESIKHKVVTRNLLPGAFCCPETEYCIVQHQTHGTSGTIIDRDSLPQALPSLLQEGDFLVTNLSDTALGVLTADCLPLLIADPENNVIAAVHAGWKGSVNAIAQKAVATMMRQYNSRISSLEAYFGPAARSCCYEVSPEFIMELSGFPFWRQTIITKEHKLYFDNVKFNTLLLEQLGFKKGQLHTEQAICTICSNNHCSHRSTSGSPERQLSTICMHTIK